MYNMKPGMKKPNMGMQPKKPAKRPTVIKTVKPKPRKGM